MLLILLVWDSTNTEGSVIPDSFVSISLSAVSTGMSSELSDIVRKIVCACWGNITGGEPLLLLPT